MKKAISVLICMIMVLALVPMRQSSAYSAIENVDITMTEPVAGNYPNNTVVIPDGTPYECYPKYTAYEAKGVSWYDETDGKSMKLNEDRFVNGHKYSVHIKLWTIAYSEYVFTTSTKSTLNGVTVACRFNEHTGIFNVYAVFVCGQAGIVKTIPSVEIWLDNPRLGSVPDYTPQYPVDEPFYYSADFTSSFFKNDMFWEDLTAGRKMQPDVDTFQSGHTYKVTIWVTARFGYTFEDDVTGKIAGYTATARKDSDSQAVFTYTFDKWQHGWAKQDGRWYYYWLGELKTGWLFDDNKWYYLEPEGEYKGSTFTDGWRKVDGRWYFFNPGGHIARNTWKEIEDGSGNWYYFSDGGQMVTDWQKLGNSWYLFNPGGTLVTGWRKINGNWYYLGTGAMRTGWQKLSGKWYYFNTAADNPEGAMVTGTKVINGKTYTFDSDGVCQNP